MRKAYIPDVFREWVQKRIIIQCLITSSRTPRLAVKDKLLWGQNKREISGTGHIQVRCCRPASQIVKKNWYCLVRLRHSHDMWISILYGFFFFFVDHAIAFYAYLSDRVRSPCVHQTLIFRTVIANVGGSYNRHSGIFTAPVSGVYVFNWNIYCSFRGDITSELVVNSSRKGGSRSDSRVTNEDHSSNGCIVVNIRKGDVVFIRIHPTHTLKGGIISYPGLYESSFSGWLLKWRKKYYHEK